MMLRDRKKIWLLAAPLLLFVVLLFLGRARRPPLLAGLGGYPTVIAFAPNGQTIVCASSNGLVQKWMPENKKWRSFRRGISYYSSQPLRVSRLRFSPDGKTLYAGGSSSSSSPARAWDVTTRQHKMEFNYASDAAFDVSPDGRYLVLGYNQTVRLVDLNGKPAAPRKNAFKKSLKDDFSNPYYFLRLPFRFISVTGFITCSAFSPDSKTLAVSVRGVQSPLTFWNVADGRQIPTKPWNMPAGSPAPTNTFNTFSMGSEPLFVEWSPDGKRLATVGGGKISLYDLVTSNVIEAAWPSSKAPSSLRMSYPDDLVTLAWSPDGRWLFSGGDEVRKWNAQDLQLVRSYKTSGPVAVSPDGKTLATAHRPDMGEPPGVRLVTL